MVKFWSLIKYGQITRTVTIQQLEYLQSQKQDYTRFQQQSCLQAAKLCMFICGRMKIAWWHYTLQQDIMKLQPTHCWIWRRMTGYTWKLKEVHMRFTIIRIISTVCFLATFYLNENINLLLCYNYLVQKNIERTKWAKLFGSFKERINCKIYLPLMSECQLIYNAYYVDYTSFFSREVWRY